MESTLMLHGFLYLGLVGLAFLIGFGIYCIAFDSSMPERPKPILTWRLSLPLLLFLGMAIAIYQGWLML